MRGKVNCGEKRRELQVVLERKLAAATWRSKVNQPGNDDASYQKQDIPRLGAFTVVIISSFSNSSRPVYNVSNAMGTHCFDTIALTLASTLLKKQQPNNPQLIAVLPLL